MKGFTLLLIIFMIFFGRPGEAQELLFKEGALVNFAPPVINKNYYLFEYGFIVRKEISKWKYGYNAFVNASLWEDWKNRSDNLHAGALGFKAGVLFPLLSKPLFYRVAGGFAKSVLHKNPIFGKDDQSVSKKTLLLFEAGLVYKFDKTYVSATFQQNNVKFFKRHIFLSVGVNY